MRIRFNYFRQLDRDQNHKIYATEPEHPLHGWSTYDGLTFVIPPKGDPNEHYLYIKHRTIEEMEVEDIA